MGIYVEILILYVILFFSGSAAFILGGAAEAEAAFSGTAILIRIFLYSIPSLALIWYLLIKSWKMEYWIIRPGRKDLLAGIITLPCLLITGFAVALVSSYIGGTSAPAALSRPSTVTEWVILGVWLICSAYLEESFFRFYLLNRRQEMNLNASSALAFSVLLFSACHIYEGPWGFLNSVFSAAILGFVFLRYNSLHGIAIAHGFYNIIVYALNSTLKGS